MILGAMCFVVAMIGSLLGHDNAVLCFAAGALFGKGYGIWEERS
jgi:hypothetical protein